MSVQTGTDRVLDDLIHRRWVLTIEGEPPNTEYVAYRPLGWSGPDPHERIAAPTRPELLAALIDRRTKEPAMAAEKKPPPGRPLTEEERRQDEAMARYGEWQDETAPAPETPGDA